MTETPKIVLEGVTKSFGDNHVLKGINLEIGNGESVVLIGGSSSGKTLILKCILGLVVPDAGSIRVDGQETTGLTEAERKDLFKRTGMLFSNRRSLTAKRSGRMWPFGYFKRKAVHARSRKS